jgi:MFS family permease
MGGIYRYRPGVDAPERPDARALVRRRRLRLLYVATLGNFLAAGLFFAAIPLFVSRELDGSRAAVGLSVGAFSLSAVFLRPLIGRGIDNHGRRPFLITGLALWMASALAFFVAEAIPAVVVIRLVQGFAGGCFYTTAAAVATDLAPEEERASAIAKFSLFLYAGFAIGPAIGEALIDGSGFPAAWLTAAGLAACGLVAVLLLPETGRAAMAVRAERAAAGVTVRRFLHPAAVAPGLVLACAAVGFASITVFSPLYAREIGMGSSGALYATFAVTVIVVRLVSLRFVDGVGRTAIALPGMALASLGLAVLAAVPEPAAAFVGVGCFGAGFALVFPALMAFTVDRVPDHERGEALGSFTAFMDVGAGLGGYLVGWVADHLGFQWGYATPSILCALGFLLLLSLSRKPARTVSDSATVALPDA